MAIEWFPTEQVVHKIGTTEAYRVWYFVPVSGGRMYQAVPLGLMPDGSAGYPSLAQLFKLRRLQ